MQRMKPRKSKLMSSHASVAKASLSDVTEDAADDLPVLPPPVVRMLLQHIFLVRFASTVVFLI